jgi:hypothetical protein
MRGYEALVLPQDDWFPSDTSHPGVEVAPKLFPLLRVHYSGWEALLMPFFIGCGQGANGWRSIPQESVRVAVRMRVCCDGR